MTLRKKLIVGAAILLPVAGITFAATAQDGHKRDHGRMIERLDTNDDGQISKAEATAERQARFAEMDANGDGALSIDEMIAHREQKRAERMARRQQRGFSRLDTNGDGQISADEFAQPADRRFARADLDENGVVTDTELAILREARHDRRMRRGERRGRRGGELRFEQGRGS